MKGLEMQYLCSLLISVLVSLGISYGADVAPGASHFESGVFEGLMLAINPQGKITGFYLEEQGEGITKTCSFFLAGEAMSDEVGVMTWDDQVFPGTIKAEKDAVKLKIARGREHPGCGLVLLPQIADGITLDQVSKAKWFELRIIIPQRAYLHSKPVASRKLRSFVVRGNVIGVLSENGDWLQVEYRGENKINKGWIRAKEAMKLKPPAR